MMTKFDKKIDRILTAILVLIIITAACIIWDSYSLHLATQSAWEVSE